MQNNIKQALNVRGMEHNYTMMNTKNAENIKQALNGRRMGHNVTTMNTKQSEKYQTS